METSRNYSLRCVQVRSGVFRYNVNSVFVSSFLSWTQMCQIGLKSVIPKW